MRQFETEHYVFNFEAGTVAERDIEAIAAGQEACFRYISDVLNVQPAFKINYFLCDSPGAVGRIYGDDEPCNGFTVAPDTIHAVYNDEIRCVGFHEDAHIISYIVNRPDCPAVREGLAMYFDRRWWGISNMDWTGYYLKTGRYVSAERLLDEATFFSLDCALTYPIMGAFADYLISKYGVQAFMGMYAQQDIPRAMETVYHKTPAELNLDFESYAGIFRIDPVLEERMEDLLDGR